MKKLLGWLMSALFVALVVWIIFRIPKVRAMITGTAAA